jgi:predicted amidohydrolase YtcJ
MRLFLLASCLLILVSAKSQTQIADLLFVNGKVWTVDKSKPTAEAVAVLGGRILAVGTNVEIRKFEGPNTKVIDLKGKRMLPGFIDNHTHFMSGGFQLQSVDLRYAKNEKEFADLIKRRAEDYPKRWISGGDWDHDNWPGSTPLHPRRRCL